MRVACESFPLCFIRAELSEHPKQFPKKRSGLPFTEAACNVPNPEFSQNVIFSIAQSCLDGSFPVYPLDRLDHSSSSKETKSVSASVSVILKERMKNN